MFRKHLGKTVGLLYLFRCLGAQMSRIHIISEQVCGRLDVCPHTKLTGDLRCDGSVITSDHVDLEPMLLGLDNGFSRVVPGRIKER